MGTTENPRRRRVAYWIELHKWKIVGFLFALPAIVFFIIAVCLTIYFVFPLGLFGVSMFGVVFSLYVFYILLSRKQLPREVREQELDLERRMYIPGMYSKGPIHLEDGGPARRQKKASNE